MNSLNILSSRVSPPPSPGASRSNSYANIFPPVTGKESRRDSRSSLDEKTTDGTSDVAEGEYSLDEAVTEESPLLEKEHSDSISIPTPGIIERLSGGIIETIRWLLSTIAAPGVYLIACLYDEGGNFAPFAHLRNVGNIFSGGARKASTAQALGLNSADDVHLPNDNNTGRSAPWRRGGRKDSRLHPVQPTSSSSSGMSSDTDSERGPSMSEEDAASSSSRHTRSRSSDEIAPARRSIRIKLHNDDSLRQRKQRKGSANSSQSNGSGAIPTTGEISPATLKSPTSSAASLSMTKYPRAPIPPRPLIPRRQPSYTLPDITTSAPKTLIIDLDETLIHSMAKGGRMGSGHMVEVKLPGPQHPILYFVHKRPHCDEFLRRICKWYNLVIFTASVQEYADPVIDWLEQERKFFSGRYYRQHCTYRNGHYIKDLTSVEPDLSKVMILDNSPLSYMFHQDNAIPIEGWINDPTDNDLLHLVPLLEGLQYVTDVRAFLSLRGGEDGKHMTTS